MALAIVGGFGISYFNAGGGQANLFYIVGPLVVGIMALSVGKSINRQKQLFESYVLTFDEDGICRTQAGLPEIRIAWDQVRVVVKDKEGGFVIQGQQKSDVIYASSYLEGYKVFEATLRGYTEIKNATGNSNQQRRNFAISFIMLVLMATVYIATNRYLVLVCGVLLTVVLTWSFYIIQSNKNIDKKTKRASWWVLIVLLTILSITYFKFVG